MKIDKISLDGKKNTLEINDKIFVNKINKKLISEILYKNIGNHKGRKAKTKQKNEITGSTSKIYAQKALVMQGTQVERLQFLLVVESSRAKRPELL